MKKRFIVPSQTAFDALSSKQVVSALGRCGNCSGRCSCAGKSAQRKRKTR